MLIYIEKKKANLLFVFYLGRYFAAVFLKIRKKMQTNIDITAYPPRQSW
jgi:hypothetical protein